MTADLLGRGSHEARRRAHNDGTDRKLLHQAAGDLLAALASAVTWHTYGHQSDDIAEALARANVPGYEAAVRLAEQYLGGKA